MSIHNLIMYDPDLYNKITGLENKIFKASTNNHQFKLLFYRHKLNRYYQEAVSIFKLNKIHDEKGGSL